VKLGKPYLRLRPTVRLPQGVFARALTNTATSPTASPGSGTV
jgi:hypothetical protein